MKTVWQKIRMVDFDFLLGRNMFAICKGIVVYAAPQHSALGLVLKVSKRIDYFHWGKTLASQLKLGFQALKKKELS